MSLTVAPDLSISVKCPHEADTERVELFLRKKWFWLEKQLVFFGKLRKKKYMKEYVSGESFYYLGRQYQLVVRQGDFDQVRLFRGRLLVDVEEYPATRQHIKMLVERWYRQKTRTVFLQRLEIISKKFKYDFSPRLRIKPMDKRWGSALSGHRVILNPKLIQASKECIDYVITHELCHFTHRNHSKKFWEMLKRMYPGWEKVKENLEQRHG